MLHGQLDMAVLEAPSTIISYYLNHETTVRDHEREPSYTIIPMDVGEVSPEKLKAVWPKLVAKYGVERMKGALIYRGKVWHVEATPSQCVVTNVDGDDETLSLVLIGAEARQITEMVFMREMLA